MSKNPQVHGSWEIDQSEQYIEKYYLSMKNKDSSNRKLCRASVKTVSLKCFYPRLLPPVTNLVPAVGCCCQGVTVTISFIAGEKRRPCEVENSTGNVLRKATSYQPETDCWWTKQRAIVSTGTVQMLSSVSADITVGGEKLASVKSWCLTPKVEAQTATCVCLSICPISIYYLSIHPSLLLYLLLFNLSRVSRVPSSEIEFEAGEIKKIRTN